MNSHTPPHTPVACERPGILAPLGFPATVSPGPVTGSVAPICEWPTSPRKAPCKNPMCFWPACTHSIRDERFSLATERRDVLSARVLFYPLTLSTGRRRALQSHRRDLFPLGLSCTPRLRQQAAGDFSERSEHFVTPPVRIQTSNEWSFSCATICVEIETKHSA